MVPGFTARKTLLQIIQDNKLTGVKAILPNSANIEEYEIFTTKGPFPIFNGLPNLQDLHSISLDEERKMISITGNESISVLSKDFEADSQWQKVSGNGEFLKLDSSDIAALITSDAVLPEHVSLPFITVVSPSSHFVTSAIIYFLTVV